MLLRVTGGFEARCYLTAELAESAEGCGNLGGAGFEIVMALSQLAATLTIHEHRHEVHDDTMCTMSTR